MTIFLLILKILGIILLSILGICIMLILLALFFPIGYLIKGSYLEKEPDIVFRIGWLFRIVQLKGYIEENQIYAYLRICGFKKILYNSSREDVLNNDTDENSDINKNEKINKKVNIKDDEEIHKNLDVTENLDFSKCEAVNESETIIDNVDIKESESKNAKKKKKLFSLDKIKEKYNTIKEKWVHLKKIWNASYTQNAIKLLKREFFYLLKVLKPSKFFLNLKFSTGSPDTTGITLGIFSCFPIWYQNRWKIVPDFEAEEFYADVQGDIKGHFYLYQVIGSLIRIIFDKNCRKLYNKLK